MNVKILKNNGSDQSVARTVSSMLLNNYKKGLAISNNEVAEESGISSSVGVDPTETVRMKNQKNNAIDGPVISKGYSVKSINASDVATSLVSYTGTSQAKEFIIQSKLLDNELDHFASLHNVGDIDEFYKQGRTGKMNKEFIEQKAEMEKQIQPIKNRLYLAKKEYRELLDAINAFMTV